MRYLPIFVDLERQKVLVVGGGEQAAQKVRLLARTPARLQLVAPMLCAELQAVVEAGGAEWLARGFLPEQLAGCRLAYAASGDAALDRKVALAAHAAAVPVNAVDRPALCSFITPAIVDRDPVVVAIGSEGAAPVLVARIRARIEAELPAALGAVARFAAGLRERIASTFADGRTRRRFWEGFFEGPTAGRLLANDRTGAMALVEDAIARTDPEQPGSVVLVGAGPGDPDLLTLRAQRELLKADVIVVDRLVDPRVLDMARRDARRILVGKTPYQGEAGIPYQDGDGLSTSQEAINAILLREAKAGNRVVRLKGGDPFVFGRAAEEITALEAAGIAVEIVPGVTAALAAAARARLPLTERGKRRALTILTGQTRDGPAEHDWRALATSGQTLALYMGVKAGPLIARKLIEAGLAPDTPVSIVENAWLPAEKVAVGRLDALTELQRSAGIAGPAVLFIGVAPLGPAGSVASRSVERAA